MLIHHIEGIGEGHLKGIAVPIKVILYEGGRKLGTMQNIGGCYMERVSDPCRYCRIFLGKVVNSNGYGLEPLGVLGACDERKAMIVTGWRGGSLRQRPHWKMWRMVQTG